mgnify:FL=1|jgi:hypothetical protein
MKLQGNLKKFLESREIDLSTYEQVHNLGAERVQKAVYFVDDTVQKLDVTNLSCEDFILIVSEKQKLNLFLRFDQLKSLDLKAFIADSAELNLNVLVEQSQKDSDLRLELLAFEKHATMNMNIVYDLSNSAKFNLGAKLSFENSENTGSMKINGILDDRAFGKSFAEIYIAPNANLTDSEMRQEVLLLSDACRNEITPALEILTDDVKAAHGVSVSRVPEDILFYFESRGVSEDCARKLYAQALKDKLFLVENTLE